MSDAPFEPIIAADRITDDLIEHCARMVYFDDDQKLPLYARIPWPKIDGATRYRYFSIAKDVLNAAASYDGRDPWVK